MTTTTPHGEQRSLPRALRWVAVAGALAGAVFYSNWVLESVFTRRLPDPHLVVSELAAADQPHAEWFRMGDRAAAVALVVAAVAALAGVRGGWRSRLGWSSVGVFAVVTALDSTVWGLVCAADTDAVCKARELAGAVPMGHQLHMVSSVIAGAAAAVSLAAFIAADFSERTTPARMRRVGLCILAALVGSSLWVPLADGIAQRTMLVAVAGWLIYAALRTASAPTPSTSRASAQSISAVAARHTLHPAASGRGCVSTRPHVAASPSPASARLGRPSTNVCHTRATALGR